MPSCWPRTSSGTAPASTCCPRPISPEKAEVVTGDEIRRILQFLRKHYDYVVVDTSKSFSPATLAAFEQADLAFIVTNVDLASLRNLQRGLPLLKRMLGRGDDHIRLIVNRYHSDNDISLEDVAADPRASRSSAP